MTADASGWADEVDLELMKIYGMMPQIALNQ